ncbi:MAG: sigma-70 family RNA polymerase sigma factor [Acidimicrobiales bacterium]|jgi:RNA polymerase sigma factor (sigma-70 family)|nr:sigma-70 family RNA polymerase sigma factor [Acidimicrobiales bacterium]
MVRRYDDEASLVEAARDGDEAAFTTLFRHWFDPCFDLAQRIVHDDDTAAEVAQETFLVAWRQLATLRDPSAFGGWVLRTSRNKALNRLERERRSTPVDRDEHPALAGLEAAGDVAGEVDARAHQDLLWAAAAALGERDASVLDLHLRHGFDAAEIAEALDVTTNNAHQLLFRMKGRLATGIRAWVLFKGGDPQCEELGRVLRAAGVTSFSAATVKVVARHVDDCDECTRRQAAVLAPEAMFAAVPLLPAGAVLRDRVASALRTDGVPLGPDAARPLPSSDPEATGASEGPGQSPPDGSPASDAVAAGAVAPVVAVVVDGAGDDSDPDPGSGRSKLLAMVAIVVALLVLGGLAILQGGADEADGVDVAVAPVDTPAGTEPRSGTSVPGEVVAPPVEPSTTAVPTSPPSTPVPRPPVTAAPPTTVAPPPPPPPPAPPAPPVISGFRATPATTPGGACPPGQWASTLVWSTTGATGVSIVGSFGGPALAGPVSGSLVACAPTPGATWTLTATGPGGQAEATA